MKKNNIKTIMLAFGMAMLSCMGVMSGNAFADSNSMTVSPPYQKMILVPGETYSNSLTVSNASGSTRDLKYTVEVGSFSQHSDESENSKDDYDSMDHISKSSYNQIMDWITLGNEGGTVAPGGVVEIPYTITVPENAPGGGQYATILVIDETTSGPAGDANIAIDQKFQFASIIYAEVAGESDMSGEISSNNIPSFLLSSPLEATSMVKNNGNVHTDASYTLQVWPLFSDEEICTNEEEPETSLILPETQRYHSQTCDLPSVGIFRAKQVVKIFGEESTVEKMVVICPLWLLFLIVFVIAALIIWLVMRMRAHKKDARATTKSE